MDPGIDPGDQVELPGPALDLPRPEADEDDEGVSFGPMSAPAAFELGVELDDRRPDWTISVLPLHVPGTADELIAGF